MFKGLGIVFLALAAFTLTMAAPGEAFSKEGKTLYKIETSMGDIVVELNEEKAPVTTANFKAYADEGFYEGTIFHRVINNFMIQGGGITTDMAPKKSDRKPIKNEADNGLKNEIYTIAMARTADPHSASSQFFINVKDNPNLDHTAPSFGGWGYCVFGKVVEGQDVVDKIKAVPTQRHESGAQDVPVEQVVIKSVSAVK